MAKVLRLTYSSALANLCEINSSFDSGILRVAYTNENRNGSFISKESYERCMDTIYNCPIVCNYNREDDSIGGHDIEFVTNDNGDMHIVNVTQPIGVVPESAKPYWEFVEEDDGTTHEYLCVDVLLWKRQEAYKKIKKDGITSESMELTVKDGKFDKKSGLYVIKDFEFTAFCLLGDGVEPCFEQASLETFTHDEFKSQMAEMMAELRETFTLINSHNNEIDIYESINKDFTKGGNEKLEEKLALNNNLDGAISASNATFSLTDILEEKFSNLNNDVAEDTNETEVEFSTDMPEEAEVQEDNAEQFSADDQCEPDVANTDTDFALNCQITDEIWHELENGERVETMWGDEPRYWLFDFDVEKFEIYVHDNTDWNIYGFSYSMNGDHVVINWSSKKRMKIALVEYDEGESVPENNGAFSHFEEKYQETVKELKQFKSDVEAKAAQVAREEVLAQFEDLADVEAFEALRENAAMYDADTLEEKCFAIRGRLGRVVKFSAEQKSTKILVDTIKDQDDPYGGIVQKYHAVKD